MLTLTVLAAYLSRKRIPKDKILTTRILNIEALFQVHLEWSSMATAPSGLHAVCLLAQLTQCEFPPHISHFLNQTDN